MTPFLVASKAGECSTTFLSSSVQQSLSPFPPLLEYQAPAPPNPRTPKPPNQPSNQSTTARLATRVTPPPPGADGAAPPPLARCSAAFHRLLGGRFSSGSSVLSPKGGAAHLSPDSLRMDVGLCWWGWAKGIPIEDRYFILLLSINDVVSENGKLVWMVSKGKLSGVQFLFYAGFYVLTSHDSQHYNFLWICVPGLKRSKKGSQKMQLFDLKLS